MGLTKPKYIWTTGASHNNPDEAMKLAWDELVRRAEEVPPVKPNFGNQLEIISRNDVQASNGYTWYVTLTGKVVAAH